MVNWYIVQTFSGFEQKVAETLKDMIQKQKLDDKINEVLVPTHEVTVVKKGKRVQKEKKDSTKVTRVVGLVKSCSPALSRPLHFSFLSLFQINLVSVISPAVGAALASLKTERYGRTAWEVH